MIIQVMGRVPNTRLINSLYNFLSNYVIAHLTETSEQLVCQEHSELGYSLLLVFIMLGEV